MHTRKPIVKLITGVAVILAPVCARAQACCSAGTPLLGSLELPSTAAGTVQLALSYEYNTLGDVLSGSEKLNDRSRRRRTHSVILETNYGISSFLTASFLISAVQQEREILPTNNSGGSLVKTQGLGDAILLLKLNPIRSNIVNQFDLSLGAGIKIPSGRSDISSDGILLPADMQPGTGAWDGIVWGYASRGFVPAAPMNVFVSASYRFTGENERYGGNNGGYKFGNELIANLGAGYRTDIFLDFSLVTRLRFVTSDRFAGSSVPNTGGWWLTVVPGVNMKFLDELVIRTTVQLPLFRRLEGTQLTTSYTASLTLFVTPN